MTSHMRSNWGGNLKFTHRYSMSFNVDYSGGSRLLFDQRNGYRIPNFELGHYLKQLCHLSVTVGVYNVTGRKNAYSIYYDTSF